MKTRSRVKVIDQATSSKQKRPEEKKTRPTHKSPSKKPKQQQKKQKQVEVQINDANQQKRQQKTKKVPKPKKYLNKNFDQIARIARSQYQKIYLLEASRDEEGAWDFFVQGASGSNYKVHVHSAGLKCTCVDFRMKQKPCKHIYFIVTQVAQNLEILDYFNNSLKISKNAFNILDEQLSKRLKSRIEKPEQKSKQEIDLKDDKDCTICFTEMDKDTESLEGCPTCKKYFHFECLSAWKKHNPTCPLCRSRFFNVVNKNDPLGKLSTIQIRSQDQ